jgi:DNA primase
MREIQNSTKSDSYSSFNSETGSVEETNGWEVEFDSPFRKSKDYYIKIIKIVNKKVHLSKIFDKLKIKFDIIYSPSGWTHKTSCPFSDHNDSSPSFGFNPIDNRFNCFGCKRSGGPVQFLSEYTGKKPFEIAKELILKYNETEEESIEVDLKDEYDGKINELIIDISNIFAEFIKKYNNHSKTIEFIESLMWCFDIYLEKHYNNKSFIESSNLEARINIIKRKLKSYEQNFNSR